MSWHANDLTNLTGGRRAIFELAAHLHPGQPTKHVFFQGFGEGAGDAHIHELWWDGNWHHNDFTDKIDAALATGSPSSYFFKGEGTQHVIYQGLDAGQGDSGRINQLWWNEDDGWHQNDLTSAAGNAPLTIGSQFGYEFSAHGLFSQRVVYETVDGRIHLLFFDNSWHHTALTGLGPAAAPPLAQIGPTAYVFTVQSQASQRVLYEGTDRHVHELVWNVVGPNNLNWFHNDLTSLAGAPLADGQPVGLMHDLDFTIHVFYRGQDQHLYELWWNNLGWHENNLTNITNSPFAAFGAVPFAYVRTQQGTLNVHYVGVDRHIHALSRDENNQWHHENLTLTAGAPIALSNPVGFQFFRVSGDFSQHLFYVTDPASGFDHHIIELTDE